LQKNKRGDVREDGYTYRCTCKRGYAQWDSPRTVFRRRIDQALRNAKKRAEEASVPFDLDVPFLHRIFPEDSVCPVLGIKMSWGEDGGVSNSPSLDRKNPTLGYLKGNVAFISNRANRIKSDASLEEILSILSYLKS
jgi:hypothetical protein